MAKGLSVRRAVVYREHTLGVMMGSGVVQVLASSVLNGAPFFQDNLLHVSEGEIRGATMDDFASYRVLHHPDYLVDQ